MLGRRARTELAAGSGARFQDVRWVAETGSTNADAMALARQGEAEGVVVVADHQSSGRGRAGRVWTAPPGASLLMSVLLRPPAAVVGLSTMVVAVAAAEAVEEVAGFSPRLKWPNDLVWPGDGTEADRKLAGILAEADWPAGSAPDAGPRPLSPEERAVVVVGLGLNVHWPKALSDELADVAVACNHVVSHPVDREELLISLLTHMAPRYEALVAGGRRALLDDWRARSATLGRPVRVELGTEDVEGVAADITDAGHLIVELATGGRRTFAAGGVVHLRPSRSA